MENRYLIITAADAARIAVALNGSSDPELRRLGERLGPDTGGDIQAMVSDLKKLPICAACSIEGQAQSCFSLDAQKVGRRLARLVGRADGTWPPNESANAGKVSEPAKKPAPQ